MQVKVRLAVVAAIVSMLASGTVAAEGGAHWSYDGAHGPAHWGVLKDEYRLCASGLMQSPVDLGSVAATGSIAIATDYRPVPLSVLNNGHTVQFNTPGAGTLTGGGTSFELLQVHFHTPSEHVRDGRHAPLEAHFVHRAADGRLAVLGVMVEEGPANPALATVIAHMPKVKADAVAPDGVMVDPAGLLPRDRALYRYMGSLTTPPCSEGVNWHVLATPVTASKEQIAALAAVMHMNARPAQPLHGRLLVGPAD